MRCAQRLLPPGAGRQPRSPATRPGTPSRPPRKSAASRRPPAGRRRRPARGRRGRQPSATSISRRRSPARRRPATAAARGSYRASAVSSRRCCARPRPGGTWTPGPTSSTARSGAEQVDGQRRRLRQRRPPAGRRRGSPSPTSTIRVSAAVSASISRTDQRAGPGAAAPVDEPRVVAGRGTRAGCRGRGRGRGGAAGARRRPPSRRRRGRVDRAHGREHDDLVVEQRAARLDEEPERKARGHAHAGQPWRPRAANVASQVTSRSSPAREPIAGRGGRLAGTPA